MESYLDGEVILQQGENVLIAVQGPLTGQYDYFYPHLWNTVEMAILENIPPLLLNSLAYDRVEIDDRCDEPGGAEAAEQLIRDYPDVIGVIGPLCSAAARGSLPIYHQNGLLSISGSATFEELSREFGWSYFNRTILNEAQMSELGVPEEWVDSIGDVQDFYTRYDTVFDGRGGPLPEDIRPLMAYTYDAVQVLLYAAEKVAIQNPDGSITIERSALAEAVRHIEGFSGITGLIEFDEDGDRVP
jgi:ABC-type branched-subunit amino acid transport system substrate-binding protein